MPVCVGIGPSKTLAKLANHIAKKHPKAAGVCDLAAMPAPVVSRLFMQIGVQEVWGVGSRLSTRLADLGIHTVLDLRQAAPGFIRQQFGVTLERCVRELRGESCLSLEEITPSKQQIVCSRSFGQLLNEQAPLMAAISYHVSRAATKLRRQASLAQALAVTLSTHPFRTDLPQYSRTLTVPLAQPSDDTLLLNQAAQKALAIIYRPEFSYYRAGVMLLELCPRQARQADLFTDEAALQRRARLMQTLDWVNNKMGQTSLRLASSTLDTRWQMRQAHRSPRYTSHWDELLVVV